MTEHPSLIAHWPLSQDSRNIVTPTATTREQDIAFAAIDSPTGPRRAAVFNGRTSFIEAGLPAGALPGDKPFTISLWLHNQAGEGDIVGDLISQFDPEVRRGFSLSVVSNNGVVSSPLANDRHLHFGIDNAVADNRWFDHGTPGNARSLTALHVHDGELYAGTLELEADEAGHLYRYEGEGAWQDLGPAADGSNCIHSLTHFNGELYAATARYNPNGSVLGDAKNTKPGGHAYRITPDGQWIDAGHIGARGARPDDEVVAGYATDKADDASGLIPYKGELLAISNHRRGLWKYDGDKDWINIGPDERLFSSTVFQGKLYTLVNGGPILRYEGDNQWTDCGKPDTSRQTYSAAIYQNELYVGTWPEGEVYRYDGDKGWLRLPRVGYEREIMGMAMYNGKMYAGTLPMANVFRMDGDWFSFVGNVDDAEVQLRRAWSMAVWNGRLFVGTLPQGRLRSYQAGAMATVDRPLDTGWRHIAAVRDCDQLRIYIDGQIAAASTRFSPQTFNITTDLPIRIGQGQHVTLDGALSDLRVHGKALNPQEIAAQIQNSPTQA